MTSFKNELFEAIMLDAFDQFKLKHPGCEQKELINKFLKRYQEYQGRQLILYKYMIKGR